MNKRILTVVATVTLLCTTSGCSGMRNFLFGRGARCGLCSNLRRPLQRINPLNRQTQVPVAPMMQAAPLAGTTCAPGLMATPNSYGPQLGCGMEAGCGREMGCGLEAGCGIETLPNSCNCGNASSYGPVIRNYGSASIDPYLAGGQVIDGGVINGMPIDGQIIGNPIMGEQVIGSSIYGGQAFDGGSWVPRGDSGIYSANKYDTDGNKIISEEPLPPGAVPAN
ncbi:hypothetical protein [Planctomycetes bacterium K23_9]|uniref:Uncharacterized protein n=1 Tax=Stieleria marina TaxID=1930275 RepID=A0A517NTN6_9BACT|nr:hypothetical protein K239x_24360 [Planctomycetes bacterium K23_9]